MSDKLVTSSGPLPASTGPSLRVTFVLASVCVAVIACICYQLGTLTNQVDNQVWRPIWHPSTLTAGGLSWLVCCVGFYLSMRPSRQNRLRRVAITLLLTGGTFLVVWSGSLMARFDRPSSEDGQDAFKLLLMGLVPLFAAMTAVAAAAFESGEQQSPSQIEK